MGTGLQWTRAISLLCSELAFLSALSLRLMAGSVGPHLKKTQKQIAALPYRAGPLAPEVMLITSRETGRWIIPKGWPHRGLPPRAVAAREAYEEAGLRGKVGKQPIGAYCYEKRLSAGRSVTCQVTVFLLEVKRQLDDWPEKQDRRRDWLPPDQAALRVEEPELSDLIAAVANRPGRSKRRPASGRKAGAGSPRKS
jgi:8-oxo-dGTP pyrophosphatase MutT (NUDIX family)